MKLWQININPCLGELRQNKRPEVSFRPLQSSFLLINVYCFSAASNLSAKKRNWYLMALYQ